MAATEQPLDQLPNLLEFSAPTLQGSLHIIFTSGKQDTWWSERSNQDPGQVNMFGEYFSAHFDLLKGQAEQMRHSTL